MFCATIRRTISRKTRKDTQMKFYETVNRGHEQRRLSEVVKSAEMKFLRSVDGCTRLADTRNDDMRRELKIWPINDRIHENDPRL